MFRQLIRGITVRSVAMCVCGLDPTPAEPNRAHFTRRETRDLIGQPTKKLCFESVGSAGSVFEAVIEAAQYLHFCRHGRMLQLTPSRLLIHHAWATAPIGRTDE